jgi:hypothetical protein
METNTPDDNRLTTKNRPEAGPHARYHSIRSDTDTQRRFTHQTLRRLHTHKHVYIGVANRQIA